MTTDSTASPLKTFGRALIDPTDRDDVINISDYRDVKVEMFATGHNLVTDINVYFSTSFC